MSDEKIPYGLDQIGYMNIFMLKKPEGIHDVIPEDEFNKVKAIIEVGCYKTEYNPEDKFEPQLTADKELHLAINVPKEYYNFTVEKLLQMTEYNLNNDSSDKFELLQVNMHHDGSFKNAMLFPHTSMTKLYIEPILGQITIICNTICYRGPMIDKMGEELAEEIIEFRQKIPK